jgi:Mce-associated membrane protein
MADDTPDSGSVESADAEKPADSNDSNDTEAPPAAAARTPLSRIALGARIGVPIVVVLAVLTGWLGYRAYQSYRVEQQHEAFVAAGRHAAMSLTNVAWETADVDVQRVLDAASGTFYDDFQKRAESYLEVVKQVKSKSEGTITSSALESVSDDTAKVLVSVTVRSSNAGVPEQAPQFWRMRLTVQDTAGQAKVSDVEFIE